MAVGVSAVAAAVVAGACAVVPLAACGGGGVGSVVQAKIMATKIRMTAKNVLNSMTPRDISGLRANGENCPTRPAYRQCRKNGQKSLVVPSSGSSSTWLGQSVALMSQNRHSEPLGTRPGGVLAARRRIRRPRSSLNWLGNAPLGNLTPRLGYIQRESLDLSTVFTLTTSCNFFAAPCSLGRKFCWRMAHAARCLGPKISP